MKVLKHVLMGLTVGMGMAACNSQPETPQIEPKNGSWRGEISLNDSVVVPFIFELEQDGEGLKAVFHNADERITTREIEDYGDSMKIVMPVFANYFLIAKAAESLTGVFVKPDAENYQLPFKAEYGITERFPSPEAKCCDINKKWRVALSEGTEDEDPAIAYFDQEDQHLKATFLTEYGDWRYLEGVISGDMLQLSSFDGGSIYYLQGKITNGERIEGLRYSGRSFMEPWSAWRDESFALPDQDTLTYLKEGYETLSFNFPNLAGDSVSNLDFEGQPMIITVMGSWCPNCMDEARHLTDLYNQYKDEGLAIVGLTFERAKSREIAIKRASKMVDDIAIPYPVLLAGATRKDNAAELLPMLNHIMSFPTTIYLNRDHEVVRIHTGFNGPGTPLYDDFVTRNISFVETELLNQL